MRSTVTASSNAAPSLSRRRAAGGFDLQHSQGIVVQGKCQGRLMQEKQCQLTSRRHQRAAAYVSLRYPTPTGDAVEQKLLRSKNNIPETDPLDSSPCGRRRQHCQLLHGRTPIGYISSISWMGTWRLWVGQCIALYIVVSSHDRVLWSGLSSHGSCRSRKHSRGWTMTEQSDRRPFRHIP